MDSGKQRIYRILGFIFHYIVAVVFLLAAFSKALDMPAFYEQIAAYGIFPELAPVAAWTFVIVECIIAGMLITHAFPQLAQLGAGLLLVLFVGVTAYGMATGQLSECGCFGNVLPRTPQQTLIEDILMIAALVFAFTVFRKDKPKKQGVRTPFLFRRSNFSSRTSSIRGVSLRRRGRDDFDYETSIHPSSHSSKV